MMTSDLKLQATNQMEELTRIIDEMEIYLSENGISRGHIARIGLIVDELFSNTVSYGFPDGGLHEISLSLSLNEQEILLVIKDDGIPFNPLDKAPPDTSAALEDRPIGGLGVHLVRNVARSVEYRRENPYNILTVVVDRTV